MIHRFHRAALAACLLAAAPAWAADYTFDVLYLGGGNAQLAAGSDDPLAVTLQAGDSFAWSISAQPGFRWSVLSGGDVFPLMALAVAEPAFRTSNHTLTLSLGGTSTLGLSEALSQQSQVHMGTNTVNLPTGLLFDRLHLQYTLVSAFEVLVEPDPNNPGGTIEVPGGPVGSTATGLLPIFGMVDVATAGNGSTTIYAPVPEPATWALWLVGLAGAAGVAARRRSAV